VNWYKKAQEETLKSINDVKALMPRIIQVSQKEYDNWDEEDIDQYAGGGICHLIADAIVDVFYDNGIDSFTISSDFEQHVYCVVRVKEGIYQVDIHHSIYETGGGFSWNKIPDIIFEPSDITIYMIDTDPNNWENY